MENTLFERKWISEFFECVTYSVRKYMREVSPIHHVTLKIFTYPCIPSTMCAFFVHTQTPVQGYIFYYKVSYNTEVVSCS